jgi:hypothetical protein
MGFRPLLVTAGVMRCWGLSDDQPTAEPVWQNVEENFALQTPLSFALDMSGLAVMLHAPLLLLLLLSSHPMAC